MVSLLFVIAIARSFGNKLCQTKPWRSVETNKTQTIAEEMKESVSARARLVKQGTASAYFIVATEAVVIGKVYDHHATENLHMMIAN